MFDSICQAYGWSPTDCRRLTMPQIIMWNHAAWVNQERGDRRYKEKRDHEDNVKESRTNPKKDSDVVVGGKKMSEMTSEEIAQNLLWE